jgi:molybdopterin synthase catalytic subunit
MTVAVRLFARVREFAGTDLVRLDVACVTVAGIRCALAARYPQAASLIARSAVAVNGEYAPGEQSVNADDEIALIPPVSGG